MSNNVSLAVYKGTK